MNDGIVFSNAHAVVEGTGGGAVFKGDGVMVFKPEFAPRSPPHHVHPCDPRCDRNDLGGWNDLYQDRKPEIHHYDDPEHFRPDCEGDGPKDRRRGTIGSDKSWHITGDRGGQPFEEWVRESDGYLLKMVSHNDQGASFTFTLDKFNTGTNVTAPPALDIKPPAKNVTGSVGQPMPLNGLNLTVVSGDTNAKADNPYRMPASVKKFVVAEVLYENVGSDPIDPGQWTLTDSQSFNYQMTFGVKDPSLNYQQIPPGAKSRGYIAFEVLRTQTGLALKAKING